jgi:hypothetical protein
MPRRAKVVRDVHVVVAAEGFALLAVHARVVRGKVDAGWSRRIGREDARRVWRQNRLDELPLQVVDEQPGVLRGAYDERTPMILPVDPDCGVIRVRCRRRVFIIEKAAPFSGSAAEASGV